jgi:hypothetical protein
MSGLENCCILQNGKNPSIPLFQRGIEGFLLCTETTFYPDAILKPDNADMARRQEMPPAI